MEIIITETEFKNSEVLKFLALRTNGYFQLIEKALTDTEILGTCNVGQDKDESLGIFVKLDILLGAKSGDDLNFINTQISERLQGLKLKNLVFQKYDSMPEIIDEFVPVFNFETLENDIENILFDVKTIDYFLKGLNIETPRKFQLKGEK